MSKSETATSRRPIGIFVLGGHRSGAALLTRTLGALGCALPADLAAQNDNNSAQFSECRESVAINDALLTALGRRWRGIRELPDDWFRRPETVAARQRIHDFLSDEFSSDALWVLNESRLSSLAPLWFEVAEELGIDVRVIVLSQHPGQLAGSLAGGDGNLVSRSQLAWYEQLLAAEYVSRQYPRALLHLDELVSGWREPAEHIAAELGIAWPNWKPTTAERLDVLFAQEKLEIAATMAVGPADAMALPTPIAQLYEELRRADGIQAWEIIARATVTHARALSLYSSTINALAKAQHSVADLAEKLGEQQARVAELLNSSSWKITAPLRYLKQVTQHPVGRFKGGSRPGTGEDTWMARRVSESRAAEPDPAASLETQGGAPQSSEAAVANKSGAEPLASPPNVEKPTAGGKPFWKRQAKLTQNLKGAAGSGVRQLDSVRQAISKAVHVAKGEGWQAADFDAEFYLQLYPDIRKSGMDPYQHFIEHGRSEGRIGVRPKFEFDSGLTSLDSARETILVVTHEASLTGAPILSLSLVRGLREKYNVVTLLLGTGPLEGAFREASIAVAGPIYDKRSEQLADDAVARLAAQHSFKFAIVNSIESVAVMEPLAKRSIPVVALLHEFASYTLPRTMFVKAFFWADEVVFSTKLTHQDALLQFPEFANKTCNILPQGRSEISIDGGNTTGRELEISRLRSLLRPDDLPIDTMLVLGLGTVHIRKGVDLFIDCASRVVLAAKGRPCRFVWIGTGYNPEQDAAYSVYLADQIRRAGLQQHVHFIDSTPDIEEAYKSADLLLLTSRLDPLPNVAIDAMTHGLPVVCFDRTTGIADILSANGMASECVAPYLDTADMAAKVLAFAGSPQLQEQVGWKLQKIARENFDMPRYVESIEAIGQLAADKVRREREHAEEIQRSALVRTDFLLPALATGTPAEVVRWGYIRPWTSGVQRRKPFAGFHPGMYGEMANDAASPDPLVSYLRAGRPVGPWQREVITSEESARPVPASLRVALHIHVYYPKLLPDFLQRLQRNRLRPDLFVSVPTPEVMDEVERLLRGYGGKVFAEVVPNRGRDIAPLLTAFGPRLVRDYDIVGHLHTKKSTDLDSSIGDTWRDFLLENLLGGAAAMADIIVGRMAEDDAIAMVFPDDPHVVGWDKNKPYAQELCRKLGMPDLLPDNFFFPVGTMFWARVESLRPLFELGLDWQDYPAEPLPYDGSMLHALERLLPFVATWRSGRFVLTNIPGVSR